MFVEGSIFIRVSEIKIVKENQINYQNVLEAKIYLDKEIDDRDLF